MEAKIRTFIDIHHAVYFEVDSLKLENQVRFVDMGVTEEFITLWENIQVGEPRKLDLTPLLQSPAMCTMAKNITDIGGRISAISAFL
jgi:hypothetical protein